MTPTITDHATAPTVTPVAGKRAMLRNGEITSPLKGDAAAAGYKPRWVAYAYTACEGQTAWMASGSYVPNWEYHPHDIIAILDDDAAPEPQPEAEVAAITGYVIGNSTIRASNVVVIEGIDGSHVFTPAEARALLQVLPGLIKIAEGK